MWTIRLWCCAYDKDSIFKRNWITIKFRIVMSGSSLWVQSGINANSKLAFMIFFVYNTNLISKMIYKCEPCALNLNHWVTIKESNRGWLVHSDHISSKINSLSTCLRCCLGFLSWPFLSLVFSFFLSSECSFSLNLQEEKW